MTEKEPALREPGCRCDFTNSRQHQLDCGSKRAEALREPKAGDVWVSKRMTRMVMDPQACLGIRLAEVPSHLEADHRFYLTPSDFRRWARTATLAVRGEG